MYTTTRDAFESAASEFVNSASKWGLTDSIQKRKGLIVGKHVTPSDTMPVQVGDDSVEVVQDFTYLGSNITSDRELKSEVECRIAKAARAFRCLQKSIFQNRHRSVETKRKVYKVVVLSVLLYGAEMWTINAGSVRCLSDFMYQNHHGHLQVPAVEGAHILEEAGSWFWDGGNYS